MIVTKTYPPMVKNLYNVLGRSAITNHQSTKENSLGQSGLHTLCDDLINIVLCSKDEHEAYKNLHTFFEEGRVDNESI